MCKLEKVGEGALMCVYEWMRVYCGCVSFDHSQEKDDWWHASVELRKKEFFQKGDVTLDSRKAKTSQDFTG